MSIGYFARATGLTSEAPRLYDEVGLVRPAEVDEGRLTDDEARAHPRRAIVNPALTPPAPPCRTSLCTDHAR